MIRGVLFDKDGTLLEFHSTQHSIYAALLACLKDDHQVPGPLLQQLSETLGHLPDRLAPDSVLQSSTNRQIAQALFDASRRYAEEHDWKPPFDESYLLELIERLSLGDDVPYVALPHVAETLSYLRHKDYRLGVATVDTLAATIAGLTKTGILDYFDYLGTGEGPRPKPDRSLADRFCEQCGVSPDELLDRRRRRERHGLRRECRGTLHRHRRRRRKRLVGLPRGRAEVCVRHQRDHRRVRSVAESGAERHGAEARDRRPGGLGGLGPRADPATFCTPLTIMTPSAIARRLRQRPPHDRPADRRRSRRRPRRSRHRAADHHARGEIVNPLSPSELTESIVEKALALGASVVGVADVEPLKASPSNRISLRIGLDLRSHRRDAPDDVVPAEVDWPAGAVSAVVIGVSHPAERPELDWYDGKGTPGNRALIGIVKELCDWLADDFSVTTWRPPYFIGSGGVFMKDAAVLAGLGSIGRNNLIVTPECGPCIRWRVLLLDREARATGPIDFDPCAGCDEPCRRACPVGAFDETAYDATALGQAQLPGIDGAYDRVTCNTKMSQDVEDAAGALAASEEQRGDLATTMNAFEEAVMALPPAGDEARYGVKYCRRCELSCPVGTR